MRTRRQRPLHTSRNLETMHDSDLPTLIISLLKVQQVQERVRVRFHIIRNALIENVGKYQSCMVSKLRIIWKERVALCKPTSAWLPFLGPYPNISEYILTKHAMRVRVKHGCELSADSQNPVTTPDFLKHPQSSGNPVSVGVPTQYDAFEENR